MDWSYLSKFVLGIIRGGLFWYILIKNGYRYDSNCYSVFSYKFAILTLIALLFFYTTFLLHLHSPYTDQMVDLDTCHISLFLKSLCSSCKVENHCSGITSTLMRPES